MRDDLATRPPMSAWAGNREPLRKALENLQSALSEQRRALSDWRLATAKLSIDVADLVQETGNYRDGLRGAESKLTGLVSTLADQHFHDGQDVDRATCLSGSHRQASMS